ncbi:LacI family DNA-binding transcriptional regulator [Microbacterium sp. 3J1]|uniref:LacI family DNA-binding transcriptional regulator n=1 Tax=Microbacterium sp. 3J1 TaxID=861269 RepID=UPI000B0ACD97|nr:LacI family DNA-binding transcriptional regulator [Microbacterium sp. 3J1]
MGVRLQDVAELAGVSMKTVSNVVRGYEHVSVSTRDRVQRAIDELGYRPNLMGRRLATGRTGLLALAFANVALPYFAELSRAVSAAAGKAGYRVLLEETDGTLEGERAVLAGSESGMVDGMLFQPSAMSSAEISRHRSELPIVILGEGAAPLPVDRVMIDNFEAARAATTHLVALGRRRIGFAGHEPQELSSTSMQRIAGYQQALEDAGLRPDPGLLFASREISPSGAVDGIGRALDAGADIDGLVCRDDLAAIGALRALQERGRHVPEDVAVTGWDNIELSRVTYPSLTTIAPDLEGLARRAVEMLAERIEGFAGVGRHELVDHRLEVRESAPAAPIPGSLQR